jgi:hypothetical protein
MDFNTTGRASALHLQMFRKRRRLLGKPTPITMNPTVRVFAITYDPHDLHGCLPAANVANSLWEGTLVDEAELEGVAAHLDEVVEEGAEAGQRVRRAEQGHVPELERSTRDQSIIAVGVAL